MDTGLSLSLAMVYRKVNGKELARMTGITEATISKTRNNKSSPNMAEVKSYCNALGYKVSEFAALSEG